MTALAPALTKRWGTQNTLLTDTVVVVLASAVLAVLAQLSFRLPYTPVPVTGQTLGVLLVGASLGAWRGGAAVLLYLAEGAAGLPVFAEGMSGLHWLTPAGPTGGYLWGFVITAVAVGFLAQRGWDRNVGSAIGIMLVGEVLVFCCGVPWLANALGMSGDEALAAGLYPFVLGEVLKLVLAAGLLPGAWKPFGGLDPPPARSVSRYQATTAVH